MMEPFPRTPQHVSDIRNVKTNALGLPGGTRRVNDGHAFSVSAWLGFIQRRFLAFRLLKQLVQADAWRRWWPSLPHGIAHLIIVRQQQPRLTILHHAGEIRWRLARIERNNNHAFGHQRQVHHRPADGIRSQTRAAIAWLQSITPQSTSYPLDLIQQFSSCYAHEFVPTNFSEHDAAVCVPKLVENCVEKIRHE